jgi:membrane associated rhomboid family serine protease
MARQGKTAVRRHCPKCGKGMHPLRLEGVDLDVCPACDGMWFDAGELSAAAGLSFSTEPTGEALRSARRTWHRCPLCAVRLYERELAPGSGIMIDQCTQCQGLFLDRGEFTQARNYFASIGAAPRARRPEREGSRDEAPATLNPDSSLLTMFQYLTGLPMELYTPQTLFPPVVCALIAANVVVLVAAYLMGLDSAIDQLGLVPARAFEPGSVHRFVTSMFMHGGVFHLLGNMYFLYIAGDNVEDRLGPWRFAAFYMMCGLAAGLAQVAGEPASAVPVVGASGAISGVLGAYVVLFPRNRFLVRWLARGLWGWYRPIEFEMPAYGYFGFWIALQVVYGLLGVPGVAWWGHIGGFGCGVAVALAVGGITSAAREAVPGGPAAGR